MCCRILVFLLVIMINGGHILVVSTDINKRVTHLVIARVMAPRKHINNNTNIGKMSTLQSGTKYLVSDCKVDGAPWFSRVVTSRTLPGILSGAHELWLASTFYL